MTNGYDMKTPSSCMLTSNKEFCNLTTWSILKYLILQGPTVYYSRGYPSGGVKQLWAINYDIRYIRFSLIKMDSYRMQVIKGYEGF